MNGVDEPLQGNEVNTPDGTRDAFRDPVFAKEMLQKEYFSLSDGIGQMLRSNSDVLVGGMTLLGAVSALAVSYRVYEILMLLPFLVGAFCIFGLRRVAEVLAMGAYRHAIEDVLTHLAGDHTVIWETTISSVVVGGLNRILGGGLYLMYALGFAASCAAAFLVVGRVKDTELVVALLIAGLGVMLAWLVHNTLALRKIEPKAYDEARKALQGWVT